MRFFEIDFFRGLAILSMIAFHFLFDLDYFGYLSLDFSLGAIYYFGKAIAIVFLLLVGISLTISYSLRKNFRHFAIRGAKIFGAGLMITAATKIILGSGTIYFGILHLIGLSIIIAYPFLRISYINLIVGFIAIYVGFIIRNYLLEVPYWLWLGFRPMHFFTLDYYPVFPWFGVVLLGIFLGNTLYKNRKRQFQLTFSHIKALDPIGFLGRHSLFIYLIHQPILFGIFNIIALLH